MNGTTKKLIQMDAETSEYQDISAKIKFKQNLIQGIGVATVFGIIGAAGQELFKLAMSKGAVDAVTIGAATSAAPVAATTAASGLAAAVPWLAIGAIVIAGIGCLYFASKYYAESVRLDQNYQAKRIADGMQAPAKTLGPIQYPDQPTAAPTVVAAMEAPVANTQPMPSTQVSNVSLDDKVVPITSLEKARA